MRCKFITNTRTKYNDPDRAQSQTCQSGVQSTRHQPTSLQETSQITNQTLGTQQACYETGDTAALGDTEVSWCTKLRSSSPGLSTGTHFSKVPENFWTCFAVRKVSGAFEKWAPGHGHCVVFLNKTLYTHNVALHPGGTGIFNDGGKPCFGLASHSGVSRNNPSQSMPQKPEIHVGSNYPDST